MRALPARAKRIGKRTALGLLVAFVLVLATRVVARRFVFPVAEVRARRGGDVPHGMVERRATAKDGARVRMLEVEAGGHGPVVVHFHNNRETAEDGASLASDLAARGLGVVLAEYRGYGASEGAPSEEGLYADAEAVLDALDARGIERRRVVLWGTSLGTGVAAEMARRGRGAALVLVTPYTSIPDLVTDVAPFVPARALVAERFDTLSKAPEIAVPTVVVHGDADEIVPFHMGVRLAGEIRDARLVRVEGGRHGDLLVVARERVLAAVTELAQRVELAAVSPSRR